MDEIKYSVEWSEIDYQRIGAFLANRIVPWGGVTAVGRWVVYWLTFILVIQAVSQGEDQLAQSSLLLITIFLAVSVLALQRYRTQFFMRKLSTSTWRSSNNDVILNGSGIHIKYPYGEQKIGWPSVVECVADLPDVVLFAMSPGEYFIFPDSSFPSGLTRAALLEQIAIWRKAAV